MFAQVCVLDCRVERLKFIKTDILWVSMKGLARKLIKTDFCSKMLQYKKTN